MQRSTTAATGKKELRQERNLAARAEDLAARRTVWRSLPSVLEYAPASACNLRCPMCDQADPQRPVIRTPASLRPRVYEELFPSTTILKPFSLSEPLVNDFEEMGTHLARHGVRLDVVTNAVLLTPRRLQRILPHLHRITFSVDSHKAEIFEKVRPPARFAEVDRNIRHAMPRLNEAGVLTRINMVLVRDALPHLPEFVDYVVDEYGIGYVDVLELVPYMPEAAAMDPFRDPGPEAVGRALERMIARAEERRLNLDLIVRAPYAQSRVFDPPPVPPTAAGAFEEAHERMRRVHPGFCEQAMMYLKVNSDGEAYPCCKAPPELRLGNLFTDGLDGVWNSRTAQDLRRRMFRGDYPRPCRECLFFRFSRTTGNAPEPSLLSRARFLGSEAARALLSRARFLRSEAARRLRDYRYRCRETRRRIGRRLGLPKILR